VLSFFKVLILIIYWQFGLNNSWAQDACTTRFEIDKTIQSMSLPEIQAACLKLTNPVEDRCQQMMGQGLNDPVCGLATPVLAAYLVKDYHLKTKIMWSLYKTHFLIIVPDYFGPGEHLWIDPSIRAFFERLAPGFEKIPKIFVGSKEQLESLFQANPLNYLVEAANINVSLLMEGYFTVTEAELSRSVPRYVRALEKQWK